MRTIGNDVIVKKMFGTTAAMVLPVIPEDAPHEVREGVARRRLVMETGECPCGAELAGPNRRQRRQMARDRARGQGALWQVTVRHEDDCPALDGPLYDAIRRWRRG